LTRRWRSTCALATCMPMRDTAPVRCFGKFRHVGLRQSVIALMDPLPNPFSELVTQGAVSQFEAEGGERAGWIAVSEPTA
jgi:hypothetical protein